MAHTEYAPQCHYVLSVALKALGTAPGAHRRDFDSAPHGKEGRKARRRGLDLLAEKNRQPACQRNVPAGRLPSSLDDLPGAWPSYSDDPGWQWPVIYQVALCFERAPGLPDRATEAFHYILDGKQEGPGGGLNRSTMI